MYGRAYMTGKKARLHVFQKKMLIKIFDFMSHVFQKKKKIFDFMSHVFQIKVRKTT